jgi:hypothetical protein
MKHFSVFWEKFLAFAVALFTFSRERRRSENHLVGAGGEKKKVRFAFFHTPTAIMSKVSAENIISSAKVTTTPCLMLHGLS